MFVWKNATAGTVGSCDGKCVVEGLFDAHVDVRRAKAEAALEDRLRVAKDESLDAEIIFL